MRIIIARVFSRLLLYFEPIIRKLHLLRLWSIVRRLMRRRNAAFTPTVYGPSLATNWDDHQFYLCVTGRSGFKLHDILRRERDEEFVFIDIGANIGLYSILASQNLNCHQVYAIDPNPVVFDQLEKNIIHNNQSDKIRPLNIGVADKNGSKTFYYKDWHQGLGNFLEKGDYQIEVQVRDYSLFDDLHKEHLGKPFILKIDVEGYESEVIQQLAASNLRDAVDEAFIEINPMWATPKDIEFIFSVMSEIGLKEIWRSSGSDQYDAYFKRPPAHKRVEQERARLGYWGQEGSIAPLYSICICNYNMADTLEQAVTSVVEQLDDQYEVLIIDDGSSDNSIEVLQKLADRYSRFRFIALPRDNQRLLGETRNISIRAARGKYVLLHIDADDEWKPYLKDFVILFHNIEAKMEEPFLLVGQQTGIAERSFMLSHGPYRNFYRCEDRDMMFRLANRERILYMDYQVYRTRLGRPPATQFFKTMRDTWSHMMFDIRLDVPDLPTKKYILDTLAAPFRKDRLFTLKFTIYRALIVIPIYLVSLFKEKITTGISWSDYMSHRNENRGTYSELMTKLGGDPDMSFLSLEAQKIFTHKIKSSGIGSQ